MKSTTFALGAAIASLALGAAATSASTQEPRLITSEVGSPAQLLFGGESLANGAVLEQAQFLFSGRNYCWYDGGWHGPGYYWCGYAYRRGFGWGGPVGWNNWGRRGEFYHGGGLHGGGSFHGGGGFHAGDHGGGGGHVGGGGGGFHVGGGAHPGGGGGGHPGGGGGHGGGGHEGGGHH